MNLSDPPAEAEQGVEGSPTGDAVPHQEGLPTFLEISQIVPNPHQPRRVFEESSIASLAASLKANGLIQPLVVRKVDSQFQLIAGERRLRAALLVGLDKLPVIILDVDAFTQAQMALVENIQREDLNPIDRAQGYRVLMDHLGVTQAELAGRLGEDRSSIANFLRLLDLAEPVRQLVRSGTLSLGHAKLIAGVTDILEQQRLADLVAGQDLSVRNLERLLAGGPPTAIATKSAAPVNSPAYQRDLEKNLSGQLGLRVQLRSGKKAGKGRLIVHYGSLDQFDQLVERLGVKLD